MADRLAALDGTLQVNSAPGQGTTIAGRLPTQHFDRLTSQLATPYVTVVSEDQIGKLRQADHAYPPV